MMRAPLAHWIRDLAVRDEMIWKSAAGDQVVFFRDTIAPLVNVSTGMEYESATIGAFVISTHRSKSIDLPVVSFERPDLGARFVIRDNFYNFKLSVISERPIDCDAFQFLFKTQPPREPDYTGDALSSCYFEGFPSELVFGYYGANRRKWSAEIHGQHKLWSVLFLCMINLGALKPLLYRTREDHLAELAADRAAREARKAAK